MPFVLSLISVLETEGYAARYNRWRAGGQKDRASTQGSQSVTPSLQEQALFLTLPFTSTKLLGLLNVIRVPRHRTVRESVFFRR